MIRRTGVKSSVPAERLGMLLQELLLEDRIVDALFRRFRAAAVLLMQSLETGTSAAFGENWKVFVGRIV